MLLLAVSAAPDSASCQTAEEYTLKSSYIERFTRFITWPENSENTFQIAILGNDPFKDSIRKTFSDVEIDGKKVEIQSIRRVEDIGNAHIVFISASMKNKLRSVLDYTHGKPILSIGDTEGYAKSGVLFNLIKDEEKIKFEVNTTSIRASSLHIDAFLLNYANVVYPLEGRNDGN